MSTLRSNVNTAAILVAIVDDDVSVRESLPELVRDLGFASEVFAAPSEFLRSGFAGKAQCLILDVAMPGMSGPELRRELLRRGYDTPTIFITARADLASRPDVREGGVDCLVKPFSGSALLGALNKALKLE